MESLEVIVERALPRLFNTACYLSGARKDAEDAVQETILAYLERCRKDPSAVRDPMGWCLTVLTRTCHRRRGPRQEGSLSQAQDVPHPAEGPGDRALSEERRDLVMRAMATLPDAEREGISLHVFGGLTIREAAAVLAVPSSTLDERIQRGLERLRGQLAPLTMGVSIAWLRELPPTPVPAGLAASLTASAAGITLASSPLTLTSGGIAMSMFSGKAGLGVSAVLAAALIGAGIQVHRVKEENKTLREELTQVPKRAEPGVPAPDRAAPTTRSAAPPEAAAVPEAKDPARLDVGALAARVRAAFAAKDAQAFSEAFLALLDAGEPAFPAVIALGAIWGEVWAEPSEWLNAPENREPAEKIWNGLMMRAPKLGGLMDAILLREGEPDGATRFALILVGLGAPSQLPKDRQATLFLGLMRKTAALDSMESQQNACVVAHVLLGSLKSKEALPEIERLAIGGSDHVRRDLLRIIAEAGMEGPEAVASLGRILEKTGDRRALQKTLPLLGSNRDPAVSALLWDLLDGEKDQNVRGQLLRALASRGENFDRIVQRLKDPGLPAQERQGAFPSLVDGAMQGGEERQKALWDLYHSEPAFRDELLAGMARHKDPKALGILVQRLRSGQMTEALSHVLQNLDAKTLRENAADLKALVSSGPSTPAWIRFNAFSSLHKADPKEALDAATSRFSQLSESERLQMTGFIVHVARGPEERAFLEVTAASDPSEKVRQMADQALQMAGQALKP